MSLQTCNILDCASIRYIANQNDIGNGSTVTEPMQGASISLKQAEKNWANYGMSSCGPRQSAAVVVKIKRNYDTYHSALMEPIRPLSVGRIDEFSDQPTQGYQDGPKKQYVAYIE